MMDVNTPEMEILPDKNGYLAQGSCYLMGEKYAEGEAQKISINSDKLEKIKMPIYSRVDGEVTKKANVEAYLRADTTPYSGYSNVPPLAFANNMASGNVRPDYIQQFEAYDSLGNTHTVFVAYRRVGDPTHNQYAIEVYSPDSTPPKVPVAYGKVKFDANRKITGNVEDGTGNMSIADGKLKGTDIEFKWKTTENQPADSKITIDFDKLEMYGDTSGGSITSDGSGVGELTKTSVDKHGNIVGHYSNGQDKKLYALAVATFNYPDALEAENGGMYSATAASGAPNIQLAGQNGAGSIKSGFLEGSNVDSTKEMTDLISMQRYYTRSFPLDFLEYGFNRLV